MSKLLPALDFPQYYMSIAFAVRRRANCTGHKVGAVLVVENRVVSTGYNGVPEGMTNCLSGGCDRCSNPAYQTGEGYDVCICVHAEENALLTAARFGIRIDGGTIYTTVRPCFTCMKALHQAHIVGVRYHKEWMPKSQLQPQYRALLEKFENGVKPVAGLDDPDDPDWVYPKKPAITS